jgi:hypothetical protein
MPPAPSTPVPPIKEEVYIAKVKIIKAEFAQIQSSYEAWKSKLSNLLAAKADDQEIKATKGEVDRFARQLEEWERKLKEL